MRAPLRGLAALASLSLALPALGFVRTTDTTTSKPLFWEAGRLTYVTNSGHFGSVPGCQSGAAAMALARASFPAWSSATRAGESAACTSFRFLDGGDSTSTVLGFDEAPGAKNENLVIFRKGLCSAQTEPSCVSPPVDPDTHLPDYGPCVQATNCWEHDAGSGSGTASGETIALTSVVYYPDTGKIVDADMELHDWDGSTGFYFTCAPPGATCTGPGQTGCVEWDVGNTVTHEAGHMLGLDHCTVNGTGASACPNSGTVGNPVYPVMAPTADAGDTDKRTLKPDDVAGVCSIYPAKSGGCGTAGGGGLALAGLSLLALRWWRRAGRVGPTR